jgi:hypothetical protein
MSIDAYDYGKQDGKAEERQRLVDVIKSYRCECVDMTYEQMEVAYPDPKKRFFEHGNCGFIDIDWLIEQLEKGEEDVPPTTLD